MPANLKKLTRASAIALATATALTCTALSGGANAADDLYDPGVTEVEFGTGWYIRGDLGLSYNGTKKESQQSSTVPGTIVQLVEDDSTDWVLSAGVGMGFRFTNNWRGELSYNYMGDSETSRRNSVIGPLPPPCSTGEARVTVFRDVDGDGIPDPVIEIVNSPIDNCITEDQTSYFLQSVMATGYYDFDTTFAGLRPFVGLGAGLVRNQYTATFGDITCTAAEEERCGPTDGGTADFGETYTQEGSRNNGTSYHLAGSLSAGFSYALSDTLFLDTTYQYTHMFEDPLWGGSDGIDAANIPTDFHTVKFGLRMEIW